MHAWYTRHPQWFAAELAALKRNYPKFVLDEGSLLNGHVSVYGELVIRPQGGAKRFPVRVDFPSNSPYAFPVVTPIESMPTFDGSNAVTSIPNAQMFDHRHQMPSGSLCLFQYESRTPEGGEAISVVDVLKRAEAWFLGHTTGRWPPDSKEAELEPHFPRTRRGIILSKTFYSERLNGQGEFFAVVDIHRVYVGRSQEEPPLIATAATVSAIVDEVIDARNDLVGIFPWIANDAWDPKAFLAIQEQQRQQKNRIEYGDVFRVNGWWWELSTEPKVFRNGKALLEVLSTIAPDGDAWAMVRRCLGTDLTVKKQQHIGLCFPGRSGQREWLFLQVSTGASDVNGAMTIYSDEQKKSRFEDANVRCIPVYGITPADIQKRNETVVAPIIAAKKVAFVGVGALGSKVAEMLAQAGVNNFHLCDGDILKVGNVARHVGGLRDCGAPKTEVVANRIFDVNPYADISSLDGMASPSHPGLKDLLTGVDLVVSTIADEGTESGFNDLAIELGVPVIYGRAMRRGQMGRVFLVRPRLDACKTCLGMISRSQPTDWVTVIERPEDVLLHECGRPVIAGSAIDLAFVAGLIARMALDYLESVPPTSNHLVWTLRATEEFGQRLNSPFSVAQSHFEPQLACPSCGAAKIREASLPDAVREFIYSEVTSSPIVETGGILIGRRDGTTAVIVRATGPGPKAVRTATRFERDVDFVQQQLDIESSKDPSNVYIGEWHSHLVPTPVPSGRDVLSLTGIAQSSNYATDCPVMLICGFDQEKKGVGELKGWAFPVESSMRSIDLT